MIEKTIVGVFGTQNVGKTTFINDLIETSRGAGADCHTWTTFGKNYRDEIERLGLKINRDGDEESQKAIHKILVQNVIDAALSDDSVRRIIMDRTPIDSYAYTIWLSRYGKTKVSKDTLDRMEYDVFKFCRLFDNLFYIPLDKCNKIEVVDDRFRDTNLEYRRQIDGIFKELYDEIVEDGYLGSTIVDTLYGDRVVRLDMFYATLYQGKH